jgi:hypothetical protein
VKLQPRPLLRRTVQVRIEARNFPDSAFRLMPATVPVQVQYFAEDSTRLALDQVRALVDFRQLNQPDSMLQPVLMPLPTTVRGARILRPMVRVTATPAPKTPSK